MRKNSAPPSLTLVLAVALLSATVLAFEVALTRVFAVLLRYHFGFLVISIAVCGLGLGGYAAHWLRRKKPLSLPWLAILLAVSIDVALAIILLGVFPYFPETYWITALVLLVPFSIAGAFLAEVFAGYADWSGRLYAWDLAGAALAAVGVVGLLQFTGAINACLFVTIMAAMTALLLIEPRHGPVLRGITLVALVLSSVVFIANGGFRPELSRRLLDIPPIPPRTDAEGSLADKNITQPLFTELGTPGHVSRIIDTRWNAFARTDVVDDKGSPGSYLIYTNGNVPTNMMRWDGNLQTIGPITADFALSDWAFAVAPLGRGGDADVRGPDLQKNGRVLSIGPGGGLDALLALYHGAAQFDGAELNPSIVGIMQDYRKYNGGIYQRPDVQVETREGRAYVREAAAQGKRYGLIFSALTKTATAAQGMALLESYIHTTDAFADYLKALEDDGQVTMVVDNAFLLARFYATAVSVLMAQGVDERTACRHIAMVYDPRRRGPYVYALMVQKSPISRRQTFAMMDHTTRRGLSPILIPDQAARAIEEYGAPIPFPAMAEGRGSLEQFVDWFRQGGLDISPRSDNQPFVLDLSPTILPIFKQLTVFVFLLALVLAALGWLDLYLQSTVRQSGRTTTPGLRPADGVYALYFLALGIGFMLVEIPLLQKLILPLGYPTLALAVILFSILLGGGLGSWVSQRFEDAKLSHWAAICALGVAILTVVSTFALNGLGNAMLLMSLPLRCLVIALVLLPLGFLLGTPFPSGLRLFARTRADHVPLIWGLNGVSSVVGSLCAAMGAKSWGFNNVMVIGAVVYLMAGLLLLSHEKWEALPDDRALSDKADIPGEPATTQEPTGTIPVGS